MDLPQLLEFRTQELCESRGGRLGLPVPNNPYGLCGRRAALHLNLNNYTMLMLFLDLFSVETVCREALRVTIIIIKRISKAPIYRPRWEHRMP